MTHLKQGQVDRAENFQFGQDGQENAVSIAVDLGHDVDPLLPGHSANARCESKIGQPCLSKQTLPSMAAVPWAKIGLPASRGTIGST
jgi:hypothetical protein